jgi:BirA family transcriptional regulator, biotin operon repressor / biotin---[acetyl-CoA-carboxylase] ligase
VRSASESPLDSNKARQCDHGAAVFSRIERFRAVDSTQRVVREWLASGEAEVCIAVAAYQTAGLGRHGREWVAPPGSALLLSVGFRPAALEARHAWRLAAVVALAMRDAAEEAAGLKDGSLWLKWPNDIVAHGPQGLRKVAGVLGESVASGDRVESAVVGIGINSDWKMIDFPWALAPAMTSLHELAGKRPIDNDALLEAFLARLEPRYAALLGGLFDAGGWSAAQLTTGRTVVVATGSDDITGTGAGVDPETGALLVRGQDGRRVAVDSGEVVRCRVL